MTIHVGLEKTNELSIQRSNDTDLEIAIVDFFDCDNIPNQIVETTQVEQMIDLDRLVGKDFKIQLKKWGEFTKNRHKCLGWDGLEMGQQ